MLLEHAGGAYSCCKGGYTYACLVCFALAIALVHVNGVIYFVRTE